MVLMMSQVLYKCFLSVTTHYEVITTLAAQKRALRLREVQYPAQGSTGGEGGARGDPGLSRAQDLIAPPPHHADLPTKGTQ